jgi:hypothetical protein
LLLQDGERPRRLWGPPLADVGLDEVGGPLYDTRFAQLEAKSEVLHFGELCNRCLVVADAEREQTKNRARIDDVSSCTQGFRQPQRVARTLRGSASLPCTASTRARQLRACMTVAS